MRSGEFTSPSSASDGILSVGDVQVNSHSDPSVVLIHLRMSKTDVFGAGVTLHLGRVQGPVCPVKALLGYLAQRGQHPGPLFCWQDGSPLTRGQLVQEVRSALLGHGLDIRRYNGHSFRIGAATTAAACGFPDSLIQTLGRWRSSAFQTYIIHSYFSYDTSKRVCSSSAC